MLTKKHFIALADVVRENPKAFTPEALDALVGFCRRQNGRFNEERWLGYIAGENGPHGGTIRKPKPKKPHPLDLL